MDNPSLKRLIEQTGCQHGYWETCVEYPNLCPGGSSTKVTLDLAAVADEIDGGVPSGPLEYRQNVARKLIDLALGGGL